MSKKREYTWYIEPLDDFTNQYLSQSLPEENTHLEKECADGKRHNLWECGHDYKYVTGLINSQQKLRFNVFAKEGNGEIRLSLLTPKKRTRLHRASGM